LYRSITRFGSAVASIFAMVARYAAARNINGLYVKLQMLMLLCFHIFATVLRNQEDQGASVV
jgi:hypothetical protein